MQMNSMQEWGLEEANYKYTERPSLEHTFSKSKNDMFGMEKASSTPTEKASKACRTPHSRYMYFHKQKNENEEEGSKGREMFKKDPKVENGYGIYFQFTTKRIDLLKRDAINQKKEPRNSYTRKCLDGYEISVDLFKSKSSTRLPDELKSQRKDDAKQVCVRFERRFKSAPKERTHRSNEETIQSSKIRLYPFYETKWRKEKEGNDGSKYLLPKDIKLNEKTETIKLMDSGNTKGFGNVEETSNVTEHLKVSSVQLAPKKASDKTQANEANDNAKRGDSQGSDIKVMQVLCSPKVNPDDGETVSDCNFSLADLLMMNSNSLRETLTLLVRITASSILLTNRQILRLIESGRLNISRFLIIKKLLLALRPTQYASIMGGRDNRPRKEIVALLFAVLEFIDRCERVLQQAKRISKLEIYENEDTEVDCTKRGVIIGKMPAISVMGYNRKNGVDNIDHQETSSKKKSNVELIKGKKIRTKRGLLNISIY